MFSMCPVPDHSCGIPCRYTLGRFRSCDWMWGALPSQLVSYFISINSHISWHPYAVKEAIWRRKLSVWLLCECTSEQNCVERRAVLEVFVVNVLWLAHISAFLCHVSVWALLHSLSKRMERVTDSTCFISIPVLYSLEIMLQTISVMFQQSWWVG
jgi:hypothetical protein